MADPLFVVDLWHRHDLYRRAVRAAVLDAFRAIGFMGDCGVLIIGHSTAPEQPVVRTEPVEDVVVVDGAQVDARMRSLMVREAEEDLLHKQVVRYPTHREMLIARLRARSMADLLDDANPGRTFFVGKSVIVDGLETRVAVQVEVISLDVVPKLSVVARPDYPPTLVHALLDEIVDRAWQALVGPDEDDLVVPLRVPTPDLVRAAASRMVRTALVAGRRAADSADMLFNAISALPYEGRPGSGTLILVSDGDRTVREDVRLVDPVSLRERRTARKLMEVTDNSSGLLVNNAGQILGIGELVGKSARSLVVSFVGRGAWDLICAGAPVLSVRDGEARLPVAPLNLPVFRELLDRVLPGSDFERLVELAEATAAHHHGAMLIISGDAAGEASRLSPQCISIEPAALTPDLVSKLTAMDGATLVDQEGRCHAVGVIVDGRATGKGDAARGSRFNNPIRYLHDNAPATVILVFSSDGGVDLLPKLMPRVHRRAVDSAVGRYVEAVAAAPPVNRLVFDRWDDVVEVEFYLSADACTRVNQASATLRRLCAEKHVPCVLNELEPDHLMDDSYWIL